MLEDRSYMRQWQPDSPWDSVAVRLMIANGVVFFVAGITQHFYPAAKGFIADYLALSLQGLGHGYVWQLFSFQFLHAGLFHILVNLLGLYFFGRELERTMGRASFAALYFGSGVLGGLVWSVVELVLGLGRNPALAGVSPGVVGASAGVFGLVAAYATINPDRSITTLLFFVLPVTFKAKVLLWISLGLALLGIAVPNDNVAHAAHLGGLLFGAFYIRSIWRADIDWDRFNPFARRAKSAAAAARVTVAKAPAKPAEKAPLSEADFVAQEIDPILDKISAHGIQSLTERERKVLEAARSKMAKR